MSRSFKLPDLGEGIHEGEILAVMINKGDSVEEGQPVLEVETDKATVEIPSPYTGKIENITCGPGDVVHVGDVLIMFDGTAEGAEEIAEIQEPVPVVKEEAAAADAQKVEEEKAEPEIPAARPKTEGPVPASPATRRLARESGVDLKLVPPTGPAGLVTADDVRKFSQKEKEGVEEGRKEIPEEKQAAPLPLMSVGMEAPRLPDFAKWGEIERVPVRSIRRATAKQMALAWSQIPHVTSHDSIDVTKLDEFRRRHKEKVQSGEAG